MRVFLRLAAAGVSTLLAGCASFEPTAPNPTSNATIYYDRNHDGVADFELHNALVPDGAWALCDSQFRGRYNLKILSGYTVTTEPVDIPVPRHVLITAGNPPINFK